MELLSRAHERKDRADISTDCFQRLAHFWWVEAEARAQTLTRDVD